jgi:uncharacterized protein (DUF1697 family)
MLRGVNVGGHNRVKMDVLRALYESLKLQDCRTYIQSGNAIFRTKETIAAQIGKKIQTAIERECGFRCEVILRTTAELRKAIAANPFADRKGIEPGKLHISFLATEPDADAWTKLMGLLKLKPVPEELHLADRDLFIYFPNGAGQSKLPWASLEKTLKTPGTARNWNSVTKMLEIAEELEAL